MELYSTKDKTLIVDLKKAVLESLAPMGGLYMPTEIPKLEQSFFDHLSSFSFKEIAFHVCASLFKDYIPSGELMGMIDRSMTFKAPVVHIKDNISTLELFHGPSLAFKDFGARFMAQLMSYFNKDENQELTILVATSGDTGGAVAAGFYDTPGVNVIILYPKGKVSDIQERQLTTLGKNITALEIDGNFDDCQTLVKTAFLDNDLKDKYKLSSANSINIARLIPQSFYYFEAVKQANQSSPICISVPSGNFGNITAGLFAQKMGLPVGKFIAATNINKVFPEYLRTGNYSPIESIATIANAMDVGSPSNFVRVQEIFPSHEKMTEKMEGFFYSDGEIRQTMKRVYEETGYILDPHGAIGYQSCEDHSQNTNFQYIFLETAHPCKFLPEVESTIENKVILPPAIEELLDKKIDKTPLNKEFSSFKSWLLK